MPNILIRVGNVEFRSNRADICLTTSACNKKKKLSTVASVLAFGFLPFDYSGLAFRGTPLLAGGLPQWCSFLGSSDTPRDTPYLTGFNREGRIVDGAGNVRLAQPGLHSPSTASTKNFSQHNFPNTQNDSGSVANARRRHTAQAKTETDTTTATTAAGDATDDAENNNKR
ncbi:MAG TPA: hypothetical protein VJC18_09180, partial [bacterium]|nr:hypothetical protein [bacterium]